MKFAEFIALLVITTIVLTNAAFWATLIYIGYHFVMKFW